MNTNILPMVSIVALFFIIVLLAIFFILQMDDKKYLQIINQKINDLMKHNEDIDSQRESLMNYENGYKKGFKAGSDELTPHIIEKAYQIGINDSDAVRKKQQLIAEEQKKGNWICFDAPSSQEVSEYIKTDKTVPSDSFVRTGTTLEEKFRIPKGIIIEGMKILDTEYDGVFGRYTVYRAQNGKHFHFSRSCSGATIPDLSFSENGNNWHERCFKCCPNSKLYLLNVPEWYIDFRDYKFKNSGAPTRYDSLTKRRKYIASYKNDFYDY